MTIDGQTLVAVMGVENKGTEVVETEHFTGDTAGGEVEGTAREDIRTEVHSKEKHLYNT